jgi:hypothetical protein
VWPPRPPEPRTLGRSRLCVGADRTPAARGVLPTAQEPFETARENGCIWRANFPPRLAIARGECHTDAGRKTMTDTPLRACAENTATSPD